MTTTPLPPEPAITLDDGLEVYTLVQMQAYVAAACADLEAENADLKRKLAEASNTLCMGGQMISAIANALKDTK